MVKLVLHPRYTGSRASRITQNKQFICMEIIKRFTYRAVHRARCTKKNHRYTRPRTDKKNALLFFGDTRKNTKGVTSYSVDC